jgi:hypothetical protein
VAVAAREAEQVAESSRRPSVAAVLAAAGALVRYYGHSRVRASTTADAAIEIPAPELEPLPAATTSPTP